MSSNFPDMLAGVKQEISEVTVHSADRYDYLRLGESY